ncbi:MAG: MBL fold metallo-hydrolase [Planctomycetota bacterium]
MNEFPHIKFLGTAGARFVMARQIRYSAGIFLRTGGQNVIIDPGPGTLLRCARCRPAIDVSRLNTLMLTHAHLDHSNDVNVMIDAMTDGGIRQRGELFAPAECLEGENRVVLNYLRQFPRRITPLGGDTTYSSGGLEFTTSVRHDHGVETYGLKFHTSHGTVSFLTDTRYFEGLKDCYSGSRLLVINVVRREPHEKYDLQHLNLAEAEGIIDAVQPEMAVLTHFGMTMVRAEPWKLAERMSGRLGVRVLAASDGRTIRLDKL